jgi:hypothetical protein
VHEHVFAAIVTNDEAEALLSVEELYDALTFADDLGRHAATTAATAAETTAAAAEAATTAAATEAAAITAAETSTIAAEAATAAAEAAAITAETAAAEATAITTAATVKIVVAETVALVLAAPAAATSVKTHALLVTFASPQRQFGQTCRANDMQNPPQRRVWESLYQLFRAARMIFTDAIMFRSFQGK